MRQRAGWYAVVLHWGRTQDTADCLQSIAPLGFDEILLIDNGTNAPELDGLAAALPSVRLVRNDENGGYGAGNNVGLRMACDGGAEFVAVLNNDAVVEYPKLLGDAESAFRLCASVGVLSPQVFYERRGWQVQPVNLQFERLLFDRFPGGGPRETPDLPSSLVPTLTFGGCCWMVPTKVLANVGFLREDLFLYHEELEYAVRLRQAGLLCAQVGTGRGRVLHRGGTTAGLSPTQAYYGARNLILVLESFPPASRPKLLALAVARAGWMTVRCLKAGRLTSSVGCLHGLADGLRGRRGRREAH